MTAADSPAAGLDPARVEAFERARGHALAASSLLDDPAVPAWTAIEHVQAGWRSLWHTTDDSDDAELDLDELADRIKAGSIPWVTDPQAAVAALCALRSTDSMPPQPAREAAALLCDAVARAEAERFFPRRATEHRRRVWRRIAMALALLIPIAIVLVLTSPNHREGPWHGEYFDNIEFEGEARVRRDGDIKFDWKRMGPTPSMPNDGFSVRWTSCMELDEALDVSFQLVSDDGSRLSVNGEPLIDNWGRHGERSRGANISLPAGVHHLRVEYFDERHAATVELKASLHGELPVSVPVRILRYPGEDFDPEDPCAAVRED